LKIDGNKFMKYMSVFLIVFGNLIFLVAITRSGGKSDAMLGILALAMGVLGFKNYSD
jgi:hypothetical protein